MREFLGIIRTDFGKTVPKVVSLQSLLEEIALSPPQFDERQ
jgi:hypothetical protein